MYTDYLPASNYSSALRNLPQHRIFRFSMRASHKFKRFWWAGAIFPLLFLCLGLLFLPLAGIQADEVFFATAIFHLPLATVFGVRILGRQIPLMLLSYLGALKSWVYFPILDRIRPSYLTVRLPALLIGCVTVWLFIRLLKKLHGQKVAWVGGALLATDTMFLLTTCYDWGPVALQHLLSLAGIAFLVEFARGGRRSRLFWAFFWFGLAFWDKALFAWVFSGLMVATIVIFPRELWSRSSPKNLGLAAAGLLIGALPLVAYNFASNFTTWRSNSRFEIAQFPSRWNALRITWDGQILFDYLAHAPWAPGVMRVPDSRLFDLSEEIHHLAGFRLHYYNALEPGFLLALALLPLLWRTRARRVMLFCLIAMAVAWLQMAFTKDAGLGAHHVVLLWPLPHWFMAVAFVEASEWRPAVLKNAWKHAGAIALAALVALLAVDNLLLTNEYYYQLAAYGANKSWDDAIFRLSEEAGHIQAPELAIYDWGIINQLVVLHRNRLPLYIADPGFLAPWTDDKARLYFRKRLAEDVWIGHTPPFQQLDDINGQLVRVARSNGFEKHMIETLADRNGRAVFEIFRFVPLGGGLASPASR